MTNLFGAYISRAQFLELTRGGKFSQIEFRKRSRQAVGSDNVLVLANQEDRDYEDAIMFAVPRDALKDFFAFTSTYVPNYFPFSSFFHVVPVEALTSIENLRPFSGGLRRWIARLTAGAAMAEHFIRARTPNGRIFQSNLNEMRATLSACLGSTIVNGYPHEAILSVSRGWGAISSNASFPKGQTSEIVKVWQIVSSSLRGPEEVDPKSDENRVISRFFTDCYRTARVDKSSLRRLSLDLTLAVDLSEISSFSREDRIKEFNVKVSELQKHDDQVIGPFVAGLLLAIAGNGSFEMIQSSKNLVDRVPQSIIWFGLCASLFQDTNVLTFSDCIGRRLQRDIARDSKLFAAPEADISLQELELIHDDNGAKMRLISELGEIVRVEILPGIVTPTTLGDASRDGRALESWQILGETLQEMQYLVSRAQRRISKNGEPIQTELFRAEGKARMRRR